MDSLFFTSKGFKQLGNDIYVYHDFLSKDEVDGFIKIFDNIREQSLFEPSLNGTSFENRVSIKIPELKIIVDRSQDLIGKDFLLGRDTLRINIMKEGDFWGEHADNHDFLHIRKLSLLLKDGDPYQIVEDTRYGMVVYFNEVEEGGELYYSTQDIKYSPNPGDLVIHSAEENCTHGVNKIIRGYRYSYSNFLSTEIKIPI